LTKLGSSENGVLRKAEPVTATQEKGRDGEVADAAVDIYPLGGRLAMFLSSEIPHEVLPTFGDRHSVTIWSLVVLKFLVLLWSIVMLVLLKGTTTRMKERPQYLKPSRREMRLRLPRPRWHPSRKRRFLFRSCSMESRTIQVLLISLYEILKTVFRHKYI